MEILHQFVYDESFSFRNLNCIFFCETVHTLYFSIQNRFSLAIIVSFWVTRIISLADKNKKRKLETCDFNKKLFPFVFPFPTVIYCFPVFAFLPGNAKNPWTGNLYRYNQQNHRKYRVVKYMFLCLYTGSPDEVINDCVLILPSESRFINFSCSPLVKNFGKKNSNRYVFPYLS